MTPDAFKTYFETKHIPLLQSLFGSLFPDSHVRHYLVRISFFEITVLCFHSLFVYLHKCLISPQFYEARIANYKSVDSIAQVTTMILL